MKKAKMSELNKKAIRMYLENHLRGINKQDCQNQIIVD
jgi:hypothetical protein